MNGVELPLHDIVDNPITSIWPLAWGWWVLALLIIIAVAVLIHALVKYQRRQTPKRLALRYLHAPQPTFSAVNQVAKRVALSYFPADQVASLQGERWHQFLITTYPKRGRDNFSQHLIPFTDQQYQSAHDDQVAKYQALITDWVRHALPPREATNV